MSQYDGDFDDVTRVDGDFEEGTGLDGKSSFLVDLRGVLKIVLVTFACVVLFIVFIIRVVDQPRRKKRTKARYGKWRQPGGGQRYHHKAL